MLGNLFRQFKFSHKFSCFTIISLIEVKFSSSNKKFVDSNKKFDNRMKECSRKSWNTRQFSRILDEKLEGKIFMKISLYCLMKIFQASGQILRCF